VFVRVSVPGPLTWLTDGNFAGILVTNPSAFPAALLLRLRRPAAGTWATPEPTLGSRSGLPGWGRSRPGCSPAPLNRAA